MEVGASIRCTGLGRHGPGPVFTCWIVRHGIFGVSIIQARAAVNEIRAVARIAGVSRLRAASAAMGGLVGGAVFRFMFRAAAVGTNLVVFAVGSDMSEILAVVASDGFVDILQHCNGMVSNEYFLGEEVVG